VQLLHNDGKEFEAVFVEVLQVARANQLSRFGAVSLDGTKIHANASRHSALSYGHAEAIEAQLKAEVQQLLALAEEADGANVPDGMSLPEELKGREDRLAAIAQAKGKIEARAGGGFEQCYNAQAMVDADPCSACGAAPKALGLACTVYVERWKPSFRARVMAIVAMANLTVGDSQ
jgi:hypothetical protein